jgi:hypothetical protein
VKGSFGGHLEELVKHFPQEIAPLAPEAAKPKVDRQRLKEKIDIHALLFRMAWELDRDGEG